MTRSSILYSLRKSLRCICCFHFHSQYCKGLHVVVRVSFLHRAKIEVHFQNCSHRRYLFPCIEVDRVKVHIIRGSSESNTGDWVEKLAGKSCAIIVTIDPPGNGRMYLYTAERRDVLPERCPKGKARGISLGPREENLEVGGDLQPNSFRLKAVYSHSLIINQC